MGAIQVPQVKQGLSERPLLIATLVEQQARQEVLAVACVLWNNP